jgi:hypothetical protein
MFEDLLADLKESYPQYRPETMESFVKGLWAAFGPRVFVHEWLKYAAKAEVWKLKPSDLPEDIPNELFPTALFVADQYLITRVTTFLTSKVNDPRIDKEDRKRYAVALGAAHAFIVSNMVTGDGTVPESDAANADGQSGEDDVVTGEGREPVFDAGFPLWLAPCFESYFRLYFN